MTKRIRTTRAPYSAKVDLSEWTLTVLDEINGKVEAALIEALDGLSEALAYIDAEHDAGSLAKQTAAEALRLAVEETEVEWSGCYDAKESTADPLSIDVHIGLGASEGENVIRRFSLRHALDGPLSECRQTGVYAPGLTRIRDALRALAEEIEVALLLAPPEDAEQG